MAWRNEQTPQICTLRDKLHARPANHEQKPHAHQPKNRARSAFMLSRVSCKYVVNSSRIFRHIRCAQFVNFQLNWVITDCSEML